ncbi:hypothetical protein KMP13_03930 [Epibacterium ulvae]|uniref:hypothetical protein n=1 Tax=Epibacterium ulvae TaxID=1156985 RepID=UPI001BFC86A0|nr:hypothetical protein [Epibacterium ulvae]MBT8153052.1 hypothetical protein [Epibacterium ulvae]
MTKGAEDVAAPGQIGRITGKGVLGPLHRNGFGHIGSTQTDGTSLGTEFTIDGTLIAKGNAKVTLAAGEQANIGVAADTSIDSTKVYKGVFVGVSNWDKVIEELNAVALAAPAGSAIFKRSFRVIDSVFYVTGYTSGTQVTLSGDVTLDLKANDQVSVVGTIKGSGEKTDRLVLSDNSTLAFSMSHLCWQYQKVVDIVPDLVGKPRPSD